MQICPWSGWSVDCDNISVVMFPKANIAIHATVMILIIAIFIFAIFVIFFNWIKIQGLQATKETCATKLLNYCTQWWKNSFKDVPYSWNDQPPSGCEKAPVSISQPASPDDCKAILGI